MLIKISVPGQDRDLDFSQFTGNSAGEFEDCKFVGNSEDVEVDAWFVVDDVNPSDSTALVRPQQVHFLSAETSWRLDKFMSPNRIEFLGQFHSVHTPFKTKHRRHYPAPAFLPWMLNSNHGTVFRAHWRDLPYLQNLGEVPKVKPVSVICSSKSWRPGHRRRLDFVENLVNYFGSDVEWFGNGVNSVESKWEALADFRYTIVLENRSDRLMFTEKILDPFLSFTEPIYWGAPDISRYLPVPSANRLDIQDFESSRNLIQRLLSTSLDSDSPTFIDSGRRKVLGELHFLRRISKIAKAFDRRAVRKGNRRLTRLRDTSHF